MSPLGCRPGYRGPVERVDVVLRKYDGRRHRWVRARHLGEDHHGRWLGTPAGTTVHYAYGGRRTGVTRHDAVRLIPRDRWWIAMFTAPPDRREIYCDICLPAHETTPGEITVVDLDLDLSRSRSGRVRLEDEDEFTENATRYGYPPAVVAGATAAAAGLREALTRRTEPFDRHYESWLARVVAPGQNAR
jgi:protein associated with RNAse G/E